jgi:hypothetical protein
LLAVGVLIMTVANNGNLPFMPRGIRNNNPGNIRWDGKTQWQGMTGQDDKGFIKFRTMAHGIRAMSKVLDSYARRGVNTIESVIATWAPAIENNVEAYVRSVEQQTGLDRHKVLTAADRPALVAAIIKHENGKTISEAMIERGLAMA